MAASCFYRIPFAEIDEIGEISLETDAGLGSRRRINSKYEPIARASQNFSHGSKERMGLNFKRKK